jgi:hypothetical protein
MSVDKDWLEFKDLKRRDFDRQVWIPLHASQHRLREGEELHAGWREEFFLAEAFGVDVAMESRARAADANDLIHANESRPYMGENGQYVAADCAEAFFEDLRGFRFVLEQRIPGVDVVEWLLNQDFVLALNLMRVDDEWVRVEEGRAVVARLIRNAATEPALLEVKAEFLKDYLRARNMGLVLGTFVQRVVVTSEDPTVLPWERPTAFEEESSKGWRWRGDVMAAHDGSNWQFGSTMRVFHMARTDFDAQDEVPMLHAEGKVETDQWEVAPEQGREVFRVSGEMWRTEWIAPASRTPRVGGEDIPSTSYFIIDGAGTRVNGNDIERRGNLWLWFKPSIVEDALSYPDGCLGWYSSETGSLRFTPQSGVHFGVNDLGFLNVLAVDIGRLPHWDQARWAAHNVAPSGTVSEELLDAQVRVNPAATIAPETRIQQVLQRLADAIRAHYGIELFHHYTHEAALLKIIHRFRVSNRQTLYALAKDLDRLFADRIDASTLQRTALNPLPNPPLKSLKALEEMVATLVTRPHARKLCAPLFGIRDLRLADAHPESGDDASALKRANVDPTAPLITQGRSMLIAFVVTVNEFAKVFEAANDIEVTAPAETDA